MEVSYRKLVPIQLCLELIPQLLSGEVLQGLLYNIFKLQIVLSSVKIQICYYNFVSWLKSHFTYFPMKAYCIFSLSKTKKHLFKRMLKAVLCRFWPKSLMNVSYTVFVLCVCVLFNVFLMSALL